MKNKYLLANILLNILVLIVGTIIIGINKTLLINTVIISISILFEAYKFIKLKRKKLNKKSKQKEPKKKIKKNKVLFYILIAIISLILIAIIVVAIFLTIIVKTAPNFDPQNLYRKESTVLLDSNGEIFAKLGLERREKVEYDDIPEVLIDAIIATEDSRYFIHNGFDLPRFLKASIGQVLNQNSGGASTLSMQVVKNNYTSVEQTIKRKFTDIYLSIFKLEKKYSKEEIFEFYVNTPFLGAGAYGVVEASRTYFNKEINELTLSEAALIAGLFQAPSQYNPLANPDLAEKRRNVVLYLMKKHNYITEEQEEIAKSIKVKDLLKDNLKNKNPYQVFVDVVVQEIETNLKKNPYVTPMIVHTTMDTTKQDGINKIMNGETFNWENEKVQAGIAVVNIHTGAIIALGGGRNLEGERVFNFATMINKQIGSTAKPLFDYGPGVEYNNWSTYTPFIDEPHGYSTGESIKNWDGGFYGFLTLKKALGQSRNIPALKAFQQVKNSNIYTFVTSLGLKPEIENGFVHEGHALGGFNGSNPLEMAAAFAAFGNGGFYTKPYSYNKIEFIDTNEVIETSPTKNKAMADSTAYIITDSLMYAASSFVGISKPGYQVAAKTGTTNFTKEVIKNNNLPSNAINDLWTVGYIPSYSIGVWYGHDKISKDTVLRDGVSRSRVRDTAILKKVIDVVAPTSEKTFKRPSSISTVGVEMGTIPAKLPSEFTPSSQITYELFKKGTEPTEISKKYSKLDKPKNFKAESTEGMQIKLSWDSINTPEYFTDEYVENFYKTNYKNYESEIERHKTNMNTEFGEIKYEIYQKDSGDNLLKIGETTNSYLIINKPTETLDMTFIVRTSWSNFKDNRSDAVEIKFHNEGIQVSLVGDSKITLSLDSVFVDIKPAYKAVSGEENITSLTTLQSTTIIKKSTNSVVESVDTSFIETYYIDYIVKYKESEYRLRRTIEIKN